MIVVSDIDGCINNLIDRTLEIYNAENNKNISVDDITTYRFSDCLSKEDSDGICALFKRKELWESLSPAYNSQQGLKTLIKDGHQVYLATATDFCNFAYKAEWIEKYFPFIYTDNIIRIMDKNLLKCDVMIDDCLDNLIGNICHRVVIDHPWNRSNSKDYVYDIHRAYNFKDVVNIIREIERGEAEWR